MTPTTEVIRDLIEKVEAGSGPDRELDAAVMFDLFAQPVGKLDDGGPRGYLWPEDDPTWSFGHRFVGIDREWFKGRRKGRETLLIERDGALVLMNSLRVPELSASIDAAVALAEKLLPGANWVIDKCKNKCGGCVSNGEIFGTKKFASGFVHDKKDAPRALLSATLRALLATMEEK